MYIIPSILPLFFWPRSPDDWLYVQLECGKKFKAMEAQTGVYHYGYANGPADALALCGLLHQVAMEASRCVAGCDSSSRTDRGTASNWWVALKASGHAGPDIAES